MSQVPLRRRFARVVCMLVGALAGGYLGPAATDQSEMFFAASLFFAAIGALIGWALTWAVSRSGKG